MSRVFAAALVVSSFLAGACAEIRGTSARGDVRAGDERQAVSRRASIRLNRYSMHLPVTRPQLMLELRGPAPPLLPALLAAARRPHSVRGQERPSGLLQTPGPALAVRGGITASGVRPAGFHPAEDVPQPIVLVDCGEDCSAWPAETPAEQSSALQPIFEATLSGAFGSSHPVAAGSEIEQASSTAAFPPAGYGALAAADSLSGIPSPPGVYAPLSSAPGLGQDCDDCHVCNPCSPWYRLFRPFCSSPTPDKGIGQERIFFAPFEIEVPMPNNHFAIRYDSADGLRYPDRAEYFWAKQGGAGPGLPERSIDYQDLRFILSAGNRRFSTITDIPLRFIDASGNGATGGLGDISIATKLLLIDGNNWKITQYFRTIMQTGAVARGLSAGHVSLEPGLLAQFKWTERRYWFGELRYLFPVGADPVHSGNVLRYSLGTSSIWYETDTFAALRTFELVGTSVLTGSKTAPDGTTVLPVDGEHSLAILPGIRLVLGPAGDLGLFELGFQGGVATNKKGFYSSLARLELRFNY